MYYALLGDIHSSKIDLEKVLVDISNKAPEAVLIGIGDLFECTISKKDITSVKFSRLKDVMILPEGLCELITFDSVIGNQEERILLLSDTNDPLRMKISEMPETFQIGQAQIIHGHQWKWGGHPWSLIHAKVESTLVFYGHSHQSVLSKNGVQQDINFGVEYSLEGAKVLVNVGAVVRNREWALYDSSKNTVRFMKATEKVWEI